VVSACETPGVTQVAQGNFRGKDSIACRRSEGKIQSLLFPSLCSIFFQEIIINSFSKFLELSRCQLLLGQFEYKIKSFIESPQNQFCQCREKKNCRAITTAVGMAITDKG
jgi:hypothetical protein